MRYLKWVEPNFRCTVVDTGGNRFEKLLFRASSEQELKALLDRKLLNADKIEEYSFSDWLERARKETKLAKKAKNKDYDYNQKLWTEVKQFLFLLSNNRCGYCETKVRVGFSGHIEHYRPKKKVEEDSKHPGYYWLAYDVDNYVPCCENCNSARGKKNHFPLARKSVRARTPLNAAKEKPLLLHPFKDDPSKHLIFLGPEGGKEFGQVKGVTERGKASVKVYNLNRGDLVLERRTVYTTIKQRLELAKTQPAVRQMIIDEFKSGETDYVIVFKPVIVKWFAEIELYERAEIKKRELALRALEKEKKLFT